MGKGNTQTHPITDATRLEQTPDERCHIVHAHFRAPKYLYPKKGVTKKKNKNNIPVHQALIPPSGGGPGSKFDSGLDSTLDNVLTNDKPPTPPAPPLLLAVFFSSS